ncbi:MAG: hypothetical protein IPL32_05775 [Chloracidobacterium sp.]|nr:hypothetical protein [Chloracidobacterium sp.]
METQEFVDVIANQIPEKDAYLILKIAKKTIEVMNLQPVISDEDFAKLSQEERFAEMMTWRIGSYQFTEEVSCVFIRFVGDETPLANVLFFPIEAIWSFLQTARQYFSGPGITLTEEEIEKHCFNKSVDMLCIMLRNIYPRIMATMQAITDETINEWYRQEFEYLREYNSRQGIFTPDMDPQVKKVRQGILQDYKKEVGNVWRGEKQRYEDFQKMRLAEEYEKLYKHWDTISLLYRSKKDWEGYARIPGFEDTPDDILDGLKGSHHRGMSLKALEHAARRVGLINLDCTDSNVLKNRKAGIQASGYSDAALYKYLDEGKKVLERARKQKAIDTTPQESKQLAE